MPRAGDDPPRDRQRPRRADAEENVRRIMRAAGRVLPDDPEANVEEIASSAGVSRATVYRHFKTRSALVAAVQADAGRAASRARDAVRPSAEPASASAPLSIPDVLDKVPPHLLGEQIVAEARRLAGVSAVALYVVDLDGMQLLRLAGSQQFPSRLPAPLTVGPELPREGLPALRAAIEEELPGSVLAPLLLRGRAIGVLLALDALQAPLLDLARHAAAALALAESYTDVVEAARRRRETTAASEVQQSLLPPRIARIAGGVLAGTVLPGYDMGGDWFDYAENADGAWIGVADSRGSGTTAAAIGAVALGAFRAKRRAGATLEEAAVAIHETVRELEVAGAFVNVVLGRWYGPSASFRWVACGHLPPLLVSPAGEVRQLAGATHAALGIGETPVLAAEARRLEPGDRLLLLSDGVLDRRTRSHEGFGMSGVRAAVARSGPGAAATVRALEDAIASASVDPLEDDATIVVFAPTPASGEQRRAGDGEG